MTISKNNSFFYLLDYHLKNNYIKFKINFLLISRSRLLSKLAENYRKREQELD